MDYSQLTNYHINNEKSVDIFPSDIGEEREEFQNVFGNYSSITNVFNNQSKLIYKYCKDKELIVEIDKLENMHLKEILELVLLNFVKHLNDLKTKEKYIINCYLWKDAEISNWESINIEVRTVFSDFEEMDKLWDSLINLVSASFTQYINRVKIKETKDELEVLKKICPFVEPLNG